MISSFAELLPCLMFLSGLISIHFRHLNLHKNTVEFAFPYILDRMFTLATDSELKPLKASD